MRKFFVQVALLLILIGIVFPQCIEAQRHIYVPAVVSGQEGGLLSLLVRIEPGNGTVYTEIRPVVGASTQISQSKAVEEAFASANKEQDECNVYFGFDEMGASPAVDGPSAGLAMTIALKSALEQTTLREDIAITGTIESGGFVGRVGGIIDKAQAASRNGKKILISPKQAIYENILLSKLSEEYDFVALEAITLQEAYEIATSKEGKEYNSNFELQTDEIPKDLPNREQNEDDKKFAKVASAINDELLEQIRYSQQGELGKYADHFEKEAQINEQIISMGYGYTAANNAFLSQIDAAFLSTPPHELDLAKEILTTQECVANMENMTPTIENLQWIAGANARKNWAISKIEQIINESNDYSSQEEKYLALREIYFARSWCIAGTQMLKQAKNIGGDKVDSDLLSDYANFRVNEATKLVDNSIIKNSESLWHIEVAKKSIEQKDYVGAIFDAAYSTAMQIASNDQNELDEQKIGQGVEYLGSAQYETLWARTYQSQGIYTTAKALEREEPVFGSYGVLMLAQQMEESFSNLELKAKNPPILVEVSKKEPQNDITSTALAVLVWGSIILLVAQLATLAIKK